VDALNDDGYLTESVADITRSLCADLPVTEDDVEQVLAFLQTLDPAGVGARPCRECICCSSRNSNLRHRAATSARIARDHLQDVADRKPDRTAPPVRRGRRPAAGCALADRAAIRGRESAFAGARRVIVPDVFVRRTDQGWPSRSNPASVRGSRSPGYASLVARSAELRDAARPAAGGALADRSLEIRNDTLLKVAATIVRRQAAFSNRVKRPCSR